MSTHEPWLRAFARSQGSRFLRRFRSERGASAVEYGLMIAGIAGMIVVVVFAFGGGTNGMFNGSCEKLWEDTSVGDCN